MPRFRAAIDAKVHATTAGQALRPRPPAPPVSLVTMLDGPAARRARALRAAARALRRDARHRRRRARRGRRSEQRGEEIRTPGLDRLLWLFLRLLLSKPRSIASCRR